MRRDQKSPPSRPKTSYRKEIKYGADFQLDWVKLIPALKDYTLKRVDFLSIAGDAPKDFITDSEYRPGHRSRRQRRESYIAKVGSKFYPNESVIEHLITRIGEIYRLRIAESKLRLIDGQVRFMSKYFLNRQKEQLTHGAEVYELCLGKENYAEIADNKAERDFFTFQMTCEAIKDAFPGHTERIVAGYVEMLTFDALIGHNDRHPYNWGVIVPILKARAPRFSPVYDTARALFWNNPENRVRQMLTDARQLETYVNKCAPPIGWDGEQRVDFFRLIGLIWNNFARYRDNIEKFLPDTPLKQSCGMVEKEFQHLLSAERRELIKRCLHLRQQKLCHALGSFEGKEEQSNAA
ncbi:MAG: HipA domain-containing protein [Pyrinomonadaceae bacterium]|nr:HipA domain-containing protein [Pyrinomonadaceae bacterium]